MTGTDGQWPYPGDSPLVIARSVALFYRQRLADADIEALAAADTKVQGLGQVWAVASLMPDMDDWLSPREAATFALVSVDRIGELRRCGRLTGVKRHGIGWRYQARNVLLALSAQPRTRAKGDAR